MTKGYIRPARPEDVSVIASDMRSADIAEVKASTGFDPEKAISNGLKAGLAEVACLPDGTPVAIWGVVTVASGVGGIWMLATNQFKLLHRQFLRECREGIERLGQDYQLLFNFTDARNTVHHRWIRWAGFTIIKRHEEFGVEKRPFLEFVRIMEKQNV